MRRSNVGNEITAEAVQRGESRICKQLDPLAGIFTGSVIRNLLFTSPGDRP